MRDQQSQSSCLSPQAQYFKFIQEFLDQNNAEYQTIHHEETLTSEESAHARGVSLSTGGKALLLKIGDDVRSDFFLFVMSASRKLNSKAIKKEMKKRGKAAKNIRFVTIEELTNITGGLVPGCVPPFGKPILKSPKADDVNGNEYEHGDDTDKYIELYVDTSIAEDNDTIAFNAGSLTDSILMSVPDYLRVSVPTGIFTFSKVCHIR
mmetsp:Transcript_19222/g.41774  ORF Transcript_19222/g.41774 Transcript_19222/m.41774 type:complete len:207 (-) Transcript_19222:636-1256(-)